MEPCVPRALPQKTPEEKDDLLPNPDFISFLQWQVQNEGALRKTLLKVQGRVNSGRGQKPFHVNRSKTNR